MANKLSRYLRRRSFFYYRHQAYKSYVAELDVSKTPLIILQMGKVGSSSITTTLQTQQNQYGVYQVHFLTKAWYDRVLGEFKRASRVNGTPSIDKHVFASQYLMKRMHNNPDEKLKIISMVRDPIARNLSAFFQAFPVYFAQANHDRNTDKSMSAFPPAELSKLFFEQFGDARHNMPLTWFERELMPLGIDVYAEPFDRAAGYTIIRGSRADLLLMRAEDLTRSMLPAIAEFLDIHLAEQVQSNIAEDKAYADAYRIFREDIEFPDEYLARMYQSKLATHFYSGEEIARFEAKWR